MKQPSLALLVTTSVLLYGCQTPAPVAEPEPAPAPPVVVAPAPAPTPAPRPPVARPPASTPPAPVVVGNAPNTPAGSGNTANQPAISPLDVRLAEGIAAYEKGDFAGSIRKLNTKELLEHPSVDTQIESRKYLAFSYCITNRRVVCRQQFDAILRARPTFDLKPTEAGHPIWGPVFKQARAAVKK